MQKLIKANAKKNQKNQKKSSGETKKGALLVISSIDRNEPLIALLSAPRFSPV